MVCQGYAHAAGRVVAGYVGVLLSIRAMRPQVGDNVAEFCSGCRYGNYVYLVALPSPLGSMDQRLIDLFDLQRCAT